jgi:hypothetical protein
MNKLLLTALAVSFLTSQACTPATGRRLQNQSPDNSSQPPNNSSAAPQSNVNSSDSLSAAPSQKELVVKEYGVYSALLTELIYGKNIEVSPEDLLVIRDFTIKGPEQLHLLSSDTRVEAETIEDYQTKNKQPLKLKRNIDVYVDYVFIPDGKPVAPGSSEFKSEYPRAKGILSLSRVGFNRAMTQALIHVEFDKGANNVEQSYWLMQFENNKVKELIRLHN